MSTVPEPTSSPLSGLRALSRSRIPFQYAPTVGVIAVGIALLLSGGLLGLLGGWVLAAGLPIAIGASLRDPRFALLPPAVWAVWLLATSGASQDASLSNTPIMVAVALAAVGGGATLLAQRAIFPAMDRGAWAPPRRRALPPLEAEEPVPAPTEPSADHTIELAVVDPIHPSDEELRSAEVAPEPTVTINAAPEHGGLRPGPAEAPAGDEPQPGLTELPLDADPAPLDEGGHVVEFSAISEVDLPAGDADPVGHLRAGTPADSGDEPQLSRRRARRQA